MTCTSVNHVTQNSVILFPPHKGGGLGWGWNLALHNAIFAPPPYLPPEVGKESSKAALDDSILYRQYPILLNKLKLLGKQLKRELAVYRLVLKHPQTPWVAKLFLGLAVAYLLLPFDLIPDFIPVIGQLDDVVIIPVLLYLALIFIPQSIIQSCREQVETQLDVK